jgi:P-type Cu+ transporter
MAATEHVELPISGMTCASCANRVERSLNKLDGVSATVNYATESALVEFDAEVAPERLLAAVRAAGYQAALPATTPAHTADTPLHPGATVSPTVGASAQPGAAASPAAAAATLDPELRHLLIAAALALPVLLLSMVPPLQFDDWQWLCLTLAAPVVVWGAWPFHVATVRNLRHGAVTMDTLISVGVVTAFAWSLYALFFGDAGMPGMRMPFELTPSRAEGTSQLYLEVASAVTVFLLAGRWLEARAKRRAGAALRALATLGAKDVARLDADGQETRVPIEALRVGERFVVRPGERVATDGVVDEGRSAIDASLLTGESLPVEVGPGSAVTGATVNAGGRLVVRATRVGSDTQLARIAALVRDAQAGKAPVQRLADRVSAVFVPVVIVLALGTLAAWLIAGESVAFAMGAAVAVLVVACPCALGLATPTALLAGTGRGAQLGLLIRGPQVLESTRRVDTIVLDKTGTVTTGRLRVVDIEGDADVLRLAGAVEDFSEHPIGTAIATAARERFGLLPAVHDFAAEAGVGVTGEVLGRSVRVARDADSAAADKPGAARPAADPFGAAGAGAQTRVAVWVDGSRVGSIALADTVKPTSRAAVAELRALGLRPILLTGDAEAPAQAVAAEVGIDEVISGVLPGEKAEVVARLQAEGRVVAMAGDGVNDAPALARADLGLAVGGGTDAAIEASDLTLVSGDLRGAADAIRLSRATLRTIKQNLAWAFAYNVAALPLAAAGLLNPLIAGLAMALSSLSVVLNALRLRTFKRETPGV